MWILGDVFMRQTYNVFHLDNKAIGIVNLDKEAEDSAGKGSSILGTFAKILIFLIFLVIGAFLVKFVYENYIKPRYAQEQEQ